MRVNSTPRLRDYKKASKDLKSKPLAESAGIRKIPALVSKWYHRKDFETLFAKSPMSVYLDGSVSNADFRLHTGIAFLVWQSKDGACSESISTLAAIAHMQKGAAMRCLAKLVKLGYVKREGGQRQIARLTLTSPALVQNADEVALTDSAQPARAMKVPHRLGQRVGECSKCKASTAVRNSLGVCESCFENLRAAMEAKRMAS